MDRPGPKTKLVRFGMFEADVEHRLLTKGGLRVRLQEQPFQILALLIDRPGELVSREEIQQKLWPADTYVAFDDGLNTAMKKLRLALGDSADNPRFIETVPRRGYRFLASPIVVAPAEVETAATSNTKNIQVEQGDQAEEIFPTTVVAPQEDVLPKVEERKRRSPPVALFAVVGAAAMLLAMAVLWHRERGAVNPADVRSRPGTRSTGARTVNPRAHDEFVQARNFWRQRTAEALSKAVDHYRLAIELDPTYSEAYAGLANCYVVMPMLSTVPIETSYARAREAAAQAVQSDDGVAQAHLAAAEVKFYADWNFAGAEKEFQRAVALDSNDAQVHQWYAEFLSIMGRHKDAIEQIRIAEHLDPSSMIIHHQAGQVFREARMYPEALWEYRSALMIQPGFGPTYAAMSVVYRRQERYLESVEAQRQADLYWDPGGSEVRDLKRVEEIARKGQKQAVLRALVALVKNHPTTPYDQALLRALVGENEEAVQLLEQALASRRPEILNIVNDPEFDVLRENLRFQKIVQQVGLASNPN